MRILTLLARPGLELSEAVTSPDGLPLLGRGTRLTRRHLRLLHGEGVRTLQVEDDPRVEPWEQVPPVPEWQRALDERFAPVEADRRMQALKQAVRAVYTDFLFDLET
ncbi:MAG: hypothetical protein KC620_01755 [Myxococcales bacterium]|nr:hypothetical protein [Myxococcales bacterium]